MQHACALTDVFKLRPHHDHPSVNTIDPGYDAANSTDGTEDYNSTPDYSDTTDGDAEYDAVTDSIQPSELDEDITSTEPLQPLQPPPSQPVRKTVRYKPFRTDAVVHGYAAMAKIDTNSSITIVSRFYLRRLGLLQAVEPYKPSCTQIVWESGVKRYPTGIMRDLEVGVPCCILPVDAYVLDAKTFDIIFGADYIDRSGAIINPRNCTMCVVNRHGNDECVDIHFGGPHACPSD
jgi:hypothetical protein